MDLPYGFGVEPWDKPEDVWDFDQMVEVVQAVKSNNMSDPKIKICHPPEREPNHEIDFRKLRNSIIAVFTYIQAWFTSD